MDRREAIKKLAIGGAIAAGGSMVLSSNNVAFASSAAGFTGLPSPSQSIPVSYQRVGSPAKVRIVVNKTDPGFPTVLSSGTVTTSYQWRLAGYSARAAFPEFTQLLVRNLADNLTLVAGPTRSARSSGRAVCGPGCPTGFSARSTTNDGITLRKKATGRILQGTPFEFPFSLDTPLQNGDIWQVDLKITWQNPGGSEVFGIYRYSGTFPNAPTRTVIQAPAA